MRTALLTVAVVGVVGCTTGPGGADSGTVAFGSGTRLKARTLGPTGAPVLLGYYDTQLGINCAFARDTQYGYRCMPTAGANGGQYEDATCTQLITQKSSCGPADAGTLVSVDQPERCVGRQRVKAYRLGTQVSLTTTYSRQRPGDPCTRFDAPSSAVYQRLLPVDDADFVAANVEVAGVAPIGVQVAVASDGAREPVDAFSFADDAGCFAMDLARAPAGSPLPCIAGDLAYDFGDNVEVNECSRPVGYSVGAQACGDAKYVMTFRQDGGVYLGSLFTAVGQLDAGSVNSGDAVAGVCRAPAEHGSRYWRRGASAPLPPTVTEAAVGTGPVKAVYQLASGSLPYAFLGRWLPEQSGRACSSVQTADAGLRCIADHRATVVWTDAQCSTGAMALAGDAGAVAVDRRFFECTPELALAAYALGAPVAPSALYERNLSGACVVGQVQTGTYFSVGAQLPWASFPEVFEHRD